MQRFVNLQAKYEVKLDERIDYGYLVVYVLVLLGVFVGSVYFSLLPSVIPVDDGDNQCKKPSYNCTCTYSALNEDILLPLWCRLVEFRTYEMHKGDKSSPGHNAAIYDAKCNGGKDNFRETKQEVLSVTAVMANTMQVLYSTPFFFEFHVSQENEVRS